MTDLATSTSLYQGLIYNVFQQRRDAAAPGLAMCFTSYAQGEGVTHVVRALANELGEHAPHRVVRVDLAYLQQQTLPATELAGQVAITENGNLSELRAPEMRTNDSAVTSAKQKTSSPWQGSWQYREECINALRSQFEYVLIDCPSLRSGGDVLSVAPLVDGVILVVEADRTTKEQVLHAEHQIESAGGKCSGHILNKRKYVVPKWIYQRLAS
jgi:Mrp family chromosome partitioning ATPase